MYKLLTIFLVFSINFTSSLFYPVHNFSYELSPDENEVFVSFETFGKKFEYKASKEENIIASHHHTMVHGHEQSHLHDRKFNGYKSIGTNHYATFVITNDRLTYALVSTKDDNYEILPKRHFMNHEEHREAVKPIDSKLIAYLHSEVDWSGIKCGSEHDNYVINREREGIIGERTAIDNNSQAAVLSSNNVQAAISPIDPVTNNPTLPNVFPELWSPCYPGSSTLHTEYIGFALDYGAYKLLGSDINNVQAYLTSLMMNLNYVYANQVNLFLSLGATSIQTAPGGPAWNQDASKGCKDISSTLNTFTDWRYSVKDDPNMQVSVWHLLSACWQPPGVVGLAWIGSLCDSKYGTSVSSLFPGNWVIVAHELGHNHGASHSWPTDRPDLIGKVGGIMDYGNGIYPPTTSNVGVYQFHPTICKSPVCNEVTGAMAGQCIAGCQPISKCFSTSKPVCGNGIVEPPEKCDDGQLNGTPNSCCNKKCQFKPKTQCVSGRCCKKCKFAPSRRLCGPNNSGYCGPEGTCIKSMCATYGMPYCGVDPTTNCTVMCMVNDKCNNMKGWTDSSTGKPLDVKLKDGSLCYNGDTLKTCKNGVCNGKL